MYMYLLVSENGLIMNRMKEKIRTCVIFLYHGNYIEGVHEIV